MNLLAIGASEMVYISLTLLQLIQQLWRKAVWQQVLCIRQSSKTVKTNISSEIGSSIFSVCRKKLKDDLPEIKLLSSAVRTTISCFFRRSIHFVQDRRYFNAAKRITKLYEQTLLNFPNLSVLSLSGVTQRQKQQKTTFEWIKACRHISYDLLT